MHGQATAAQVADATMYTIGHNIIGWSLVWVGDATLRSMRRPPPVTVSPQRSSSPGGVIRCPGCHCARDGAAERSNRWMCHFSRDTIWAVPSFIVRLGGAAVFTVALTREAYGEVSSDRILNVVLYAIGINVAGTALLAIGNAFRSARQPQPQLWSCGIHKGVAHMFRPTLVVLCILLLAGCSGSSGGTGTTKRTSDPRCKGGGMFIYVDEPDYDPAVEVSGGIEAPNTSLHQKLGLAIFANGTGLKTLQEQGRIFDKYTVASGELVKDRDAIAQFYHHKLRDVGLVHVTDVIGIGSLQSSCDQLQGLMPYRFTFIKPDTPVTTREHLESVTHLEIVQRGSDQLEVSLSRSTPEKIEQTLDEQTEKPVLRRHAKVVAKRANVSGYSSRTSTTYYASFELDDGPRVEFAVGDTQFGLLAEGDTGVLISKGALFQAFERDS